MGKLTMINKIKNEKLIKNSKGQIAIIILLASAIVLTLGLSASKSAITDTKVDTDEELLKEAFNTAESAINNYLDNSEITYSTEGGGASIVSTSIGGEDNTTSLSSEGKVLANTNQLFWLVNHNSDGSIGTSATDYYSVGDISLKVNDTDTDFNGALKIDYFYIDNNDDYQVKRIGCNYNSSNLVDGFDSTKDNCSNLTNPTNLKHPLLISITPLGSATSLTISGLADFPSQGEEITAVSITDSGVKTQIKTRYIYQFPSFMLDAITAKGVIE